MKPLAKISGPDLETSSEFTFPDLWSRQETPHWRRLVFGVSGGEVPLILQLCRDMDGPFGILYILLTSRLGNKPGRYESPLSLGFDEIERFLLTFENFLEQDGRHHLWITSLSDEGQFIFDRHNLVYAYGDLDRIEERLRTHGLSQGELAVPVPHAHHYHAEFDMSEDELLKYWSWRRSPLDPSDED